MHLDITTIDPENRKFQPQWRGMALGKNTKENIIVALYTLRVVYAIAAAIT